MLSKQSSFLSKLPQVPCHRGMQIEGGEKWCLPSALQGSSGWSIRKSSGIHLWVSISFPHWTLAGFLFNLNLFPNGAIYLRTELVCPTKAMLTSIMISCVLLSMLALTKGIPSRLREFWELGKPGITVLMHEREMGIMWPGFNFISNAKFSEYIPQ